MSCADSDHPLLPIALSLSLYNIFDYNLVRECKFIKKYLKKWCSLGSEYCFFHFLFPTRIVIKKSLKLSGLTALQECIS